MKTITVCMATRNGGRFIQRQLDSILPQLGPDDELIISDDSSTDDTTDIIKSLGDQRIKLLEHNKFFSPVRNIENALFHAGGDIIVLSDQDDVWLDNKVSVILKHLDEMPSRIALISLDGSVVDEQEAVTFESLFTKIGAGPGLFKNIFNNTYMGCCLAFKRELLEVALPFPKHIPMHDMWLGLLAEIHGKVRFVPEKTILYRKHSASVTEFAIRFMPVTQIKRRWHLTYNLVKRSFEIKFQKSG